MYICFIWTTSKISGEDFKQRLDEPKLPNNYYAKDSSQVYCKQKSVFLSSTTCPHPIHQKNKQKKENVVRDLSTMIIRISTGFFWEMNNKPGSTFQDYTKWARLILGIKNEDLFS